MGDIDDIMVLTSTMNTKMTAWQTDTLSNVSPAYLGILNLYLSTVSQFIIQ